MGTGLKINSYLNFDGNAFHAFNFYKSIFGGEFSAVQRFKDMPTGEIVPAEKEKDRIMHIALPIEGGAVLLGSDISPSMGHRLTAGNNVYVSLHPGTLAEAERLFKLLADDGKVEMPLGKMFWGAWYASFADKFGVKWMINYEEK